MALWHASRKANQGYYEPRLGVLEAGATDFTTVTVPSTVTGTPLRPCFLAYRRRFYVLGIFSPNVVVTEDRQVFPMGIHAPIAAPTLANSGTGLTGSYIGYITFVHKDPTGSYVIHESNLSAASSTLSLTNGGRSWSNLPTTSIDSRVTHKRGYVSVGGAVPRLAWERELGTVTTVTETVSDSVLSTSTPAPVDSDSDLTHGRGAPPFFQFGAIWRDRLWGVGSPGDILHFSELFEPESFALDATKKFIHKNTLRTKGGESILGLFPFEDGLLIQCVGCEYVLTGYGPTTFEMHRVSSVTAISHHGNANCFGALVYPTANGLGFRTAPAEGQFRNLMARNYIDQWATDYAAEPLPFETSQGVYNPRSGEYILLTNPATAPKTKCYVIPARQVVEEGQLDPPLMKWIQTRETTCVGLWSAAGAKQPTVVFGGQDGYVRKLDATDGDDDSDTYGKDVTITHKHLFFGDQGGDDNHGRRFNHIDVFCKTENQAATVSLYPGDDDASSGATPHSRQIDASAASGYVAKTSHRLGLNTVAGKGVTVKITADSPVGFEYRGFGIEYTEGGQTRLSTT